MTMPHLKRHEQKICSGEDSARSCRCWSARAKVRPQVCARKDWVSSWAHASSHATTTSRGNEIDAGRAHQPRSSRCLASYPCTRSRRLGRTAISHELHAELDRGEADRHCLDRNDVGMCQGVEETRFEEERDHVVCVGMHGDLDRHLASTRARTLARQVRRDGATARRAPLSRMNHRRTHDDDPITSANA